MLRREIEQGIDHRRQVNSLSGSAKLGVKRAHAEIGSQ